MYPWSIETILLVISALLAVLVFSRRTTKRNRRPEQGAVLSIGFLHPYPLSGGGGERVLWCAILAVRQLFPDAQIVLFSAWSEADVANGKVVNESKATVRKQFGLDLGDVSFVPVAIDSVHLVDPTRYPRLTLLLQAIGAVRLGAHSYRKHPVDVFVDTANLTFALLLPRLWGSRTVSYVHYPTISTDMLTIVRTRKEQFNNSSVITKSPLLSLLKLLYYKTFASIYALAALFCDLPLANSSWTRNHLKALWWKGARIETIFPPCPSFCGSSKSSDSRDPLLIVSVGQFRPEKNHALQLDIMAHLQTRMKPTPRLVMIGGTRNAGDKERAEHLRAKVIERDLPVTIIENASREELNRTLDTASVGLHTMRDEHFGISVVELQAHGLVTVAHRSGGVCLDIIEDGRNGLLAGDGADLYADQIEKAIFGMSETEREEVRVKAVMSAERFSDRAFQERFGSVFEAWVDVMFRVHENDGRTFAR